MRNKLLYLLSTLFAGVLVFDSCSNELELNYQRYFVNGKGLYEKNCQNCHGANGEGLGKLYPPLTDTAFLSKNRSSLACMIKNGLKGKMSVNNVSYETEMPGNTALADIDIAQIIVYITNSFGNKQSFYDQKQVVADIKGCQ
ncbi:c-type cytochrome [Daejeonella sp.]|uniref:c-type cytochrome n=1 Tax=Daejeonella sp. TaxID=2805397 RepID=UPI00398378C7